jgi:glyceraldehyde-3-phosphate dehydrogenase (NAD(P))
MHLHSVIVKLRDKATTEDVLEVWDETPRVRFVLAKDGIKSTAQIMELARDLGKKRSDLYDIAVWRDGVHVVDNVLYYYQAIHQEADVVPENIDAIRAMCELEKDKMKSIHKTDKAMGIA